MRGKFIVEGLDFVDRVALVTKALVARLFGEQKDDINIRIVGKLDVQISEMYSVFSVVEEVKILKDFRKAKEQSGNDTYFVIVNFSFKNAEELGCTLQGKGWIGVRVKGNEVEVNFTPLWGFDVVVKQEEEDKDRALRVAIGKIHTESYSAALESGYDIYEALRSAIETAFLAFNKDIDDVIQRTASSPA